MPDPVTGLIVGGTALVGGALSSREQRKGAQAAGQAQVEAARLGVDETRRQFDAIQELFKPYVEGGGEAFKTQQALLGLLGQPAQQEAVSGIETSPIFQALTRQGETALLQNASATGGLRGGNIQTALAEFRPQLLDSLLQQRFANLGSLASMGQASAAGQAAAGQQTGANIATLYGQQGAARAGEALASSQAKADLFNLPTKLFGTYVGGGGTF